jgi:hypothetical protein
LETVGRPAKRSYDAETAIRAGDIHSDMGLQNRLPAVLAELDAEKFQKLCGLQFIRREGTTSAPNTETESTSANQFSIPLGYGNPVLEKPRQAHLEELVSTTSTLLL